MESNKSNINIKINIRGANNINILEILLASVLAVVRVSVVLVMVVAIIVLLFLITSVVFPEVTRTK